METWNREELYKEVWDQPLVKRFTHLRNGKVDLAVLLPREPSLHVQELLASLGIELLWFRGKSLAGTVSL